MQFSNHFHFLVSCRLTLGVEKRQLQTKVFVSVYIGRHWACFHHTVGHLSDQKANHLQQHCGSNTLHEYYQCIYHFYAMHNIVVQSCTNSSLRRQVQAIPPLPRLCLKVLGWEWNYVKTDLVSISRSHQVTQTRNFDAHAFYVRSCLPSFTWTWPPTTEWNGGGLVWSFKKCSPQI